MEGGALRLTAKGVPCGHWRLSLRCAGAKYGRGDAPALVEVQPGALAAGCCEAAGSGLSHALLGKTASFTVTARDADGNRRRMARGAREGKCPFRVAIVTAPGLIDARLTQRADGSYRVSYVPFGSAGTYVIAVTYAAKPIAGSPFRVHVRHAEHAAATQARLVTGGPPRPSTAPASRGGGGGGGGAGKEGKDGTPRAAAWRAVPAPPRGMARGAAAIAAHNARRARPATAAPAKRPCPVAPSKKPEKLLAAPWPRDLPGAAPQHRAAPGARQPSILPGSVVVAL